MKPVISFFENDLYFYCTQYTVYQCEKKDEVSGFLKKIQADFHDYTKIIKLNFDTFHNTDSAQQKIIQTPLILVYILDQYELLSFKEIKNKLKITEQENLQFISLITKEKFKSAVQSIADDISAGRFYQINLTSAFKTQTSDHFDTLSYFVSIAEKIHCPYKAYLPFNGQDILCFSPELFLSKKNETITTQPIKGTLLPGQNLTDLTSSYKEDSELSMIVDLLRNDLNKLSCETYKSKSVVNFHRNLMDLKYTVHTYSEVSIKTSEQLPEILNKTYPGGSISGCPKIESLKKIAEIEPNSRDFYTGSIGWWIKDDFCLNIAIRSFINASNEMFYFTGCGIVFDSNPESEWTEFLTKAAFINPESQENVSVLDTLLFKNNNFTFLNLHIDRTLSSLNFYNKNINRTILENIYDNIKTEIKNNILATTFENDLRVKIEFPLHLSPENYKYSFEKIDLNSNAIINLYLYRPTNNFTYSQIKNNLRLHWDSALNAKPENCEDILVVNQLGLITESSIYSIFYKQDGLFFTPPLNDGCLNGVLRKHWLNLGHISIDQKTYSLSERSLHINDINSVEIYVGNSVRGIKKARVINPGFCN